MKSIYDRANFKIEHCEPTNQFLENRKHAFAQWLFAMLHASFWKVWLRFAKIEARERSITKLDFISKVDSPLKFM